MLLLSFQSDLDPKLITGSRSSTWLNIRFSITSRIFSYEVQDRFLPPWEARARKANFTTSLRKSFGLAMPAGFSILDSSWFRSSRIQKLPGVRILEVLILDPCIGVIHIAIEQVLTIVVVRLQICLLDFVANELGITRRQLLLKNSR